MYLIQASLFKNGEYQQALNFYNWPFFSYLIGQFSRISPLDILLNAHLLSGIFLVVMSYYFLRICQHISNSNILIPGAVLFSSIAIFDSYVEMIIRDHGFWAAIMAGCYYLFRYFADKVTINILLMSLAFIISGLFRVEGFVYLISSYLVIFLLIDLKKITKFKLTLLPFFLLMILFCILYFIDVGKLHEFIIRPMSMIDNLFNHNLISSANNGLTILIGQHQALMLISSALSIIVWKIFFVVNPVNCLVLYLGRFHLKKNHNLMISYAMIVTSLIIIFVSILSFWVATSRYFIPLALFVLPLVVMVINKFFNNKSKQSLIFWKLSISKQIVKFCFFLYVFVFFLISLLDSRSANFEKDMVTWISQNIHSEHKVYIEDYRVRYFSNQLNDFPKCNSLDCFKDYNYVLLRYDSIYIHLFKQFEIVHDFKKNNKPKFYLYRIRGND